MGGTGEAVAGTREFRNVRDGNQKVALVIDDLVSLDPFTARCIRIYGRAEQLIERDGLVGPGLYMRITPIISWSWNMAGVPPATSGTRRGVPATRYRIRTSRDRGSTPRH